jgi:transcriptional regulator with XRE-family HTH domain
VRVEDGVADDVDLGFDIPLVARRFLVALRGQRSQVQWSRRLGYKSNVAYAWESGRRWPTGAETMRAAARSGIDVPAALERFYGASPTHLPDDPTSPEGVARLLDDLRGRATVAELARRAGVSRYSLTRWLSAQTQPRLPDFLRVLHAASLRLVDFVACFVDPEDIEPLAGAWRALEARRRGAAELPWTQAVLRALELDDYRALDAHRAGWVASRLGIAVQAEEAALSFLVDTGQVRFDGRRYRPESLVVDTRMAPEVGRRLKEHWTGVAAEKLREGAPGQYSYNVFTVSRADLERIREMHLAYFRALRAVAAESDRAEVVAVVNVQLVPLEGPAE